MPEKKCKVLSKCGGCQYYGTPMDEQLKSKQKKMEKLLEAFAKPEPIIGMQNPYHYRNKVHHVLKMIKGGRVISGSYEEGTHNVVNIDECGIEDLKCQQIIKTICTLAQSFKLKIYNEDTGWGFLRHVLVRRGFKSGEIMVVLVCASPVFPSKNNFVKALKAAHPEITTIVQNINDKKTSMVLGSKNINLYGKGYITDTLCGMKFRISPDSFFQVNPVQTEMLYRKAMEYAQLKDNDTVIDAYSGIGTIGLVASQYAGKVIGVELNKNAVHDAIINAKENNADNVSFYQGDAGEFMLQMAENKESADVVFMDPPRSGSTEQFMSSVIKMKPDRIVYISCGPDTLARDLKYFVSRNYRVVKIQPVDMFPHTEHIETVVLMIRA
ncbi:MAG: 23S rRNA (uracil(1939)-C(5))-methyltransferase RlmD [Lachnospiraceae bacterium]|nr:23S rRNA (uracil(1939)-C(5))-methyltransferase RlmD [Lachnospiraceae bacterium]